MCEQGLTHSPAGKESSEGALPDFALSVRTVLRWTKWDTLRRRGPPVSAPRPCGL